MFLYYNLGLKALQIYVVENIYYLYNLSHLKILTWTVVLCFYVLL